MDVHADMDVTPFSIEKVHNSWGGNMVQALIPLDAMGHNRFSMKVLPRSHVWHEADTYSSRNFCAFYEQFEAGLSTKHKVGDMREIEIRLDPGDMLLHNGGLFHSVNSSSACTLETCRRVQISWFEAETTKWRQDIPPKPWPFIHSEYQMDMEKVDTLPRVSSGREGFPRVTKSDSEHAEHSGYSVSFGRFSGPDPVIPSLSEWLAFVLHVLRHGFNPKKDIANTCSHKI